jgi:hypothetical protein
LLKLEDAEATSVKGHSRFAPEASIRPRSTSRWAKVKLAYSSDVVRS